MVPVSNCTAFVPTTPTLSNTPTLSSTPTHSLSITSALASPLAPPRSSAPVSAPTLLTQLAPARQITPRHNDNSLGKGTGTIIVLFRNDLRLDDHPALNHAVEEAATVIPLFCFDPRHFGRTEFGFEKTGKYRARFLIDSVHDLRESLRKRASDLVVRIGKPEDILPALVKKTGARAVFLHSEVTYEDRQVETDLEKRLKKQGSELQTFWTNTLYHNEDLPFDIENMPDVYSDFRVAVEKSGIIRTPLPAPESLSRLPKGLSVGEVPTLRALGVSDIPITPTRVNSTGVSTITGGEAEAMARVKSYVEERRRMDAESSLRSEVTANLTSDFSCRISPWLAVGCISPRRIFDDMKVGSPNPERLLNSSTYFELVWRDFFKCITAKYAGKRSSGLLSTPRRKTMVGV